MSSSQPSDFIVTSYAQNAHIIRALDNLNLARLNKVANPSIEDLCRIIRLDWTDDKRGLSSLELEVRELVGLKLVPQKPNGKWIAAALEISRILNTPPEELWPGTLATTIPYKRSQKSEARIGESVSWTVMKLETEDA